MTEIKTDVTSEVKAEITFRDLWLSENVLRAIEQKGYKTPSSIQAWVIPLALNTDKDIIGQAQTGSGKTAAFGLPILDRLNPNSRDAQALILTPTRELAIQIAEELKSFSIHSNLNITLLYGWQNIRTEMSALKSGPQIIVWTPGRVTDHLQKGRLNLDGIKYFVLDEADEMLNVGFREEIEEILKFSPVDKKVFLFSATMPPFILNIVKNYMRDYETIAIKKSELTNDKITQVYYEAPRGHKFDVLGRILDVNPDFYWIIFCRTKAETDEVASKLSQRGYLAEAIHGDIEQAMREKVLARFKKRYVSILVATDVAARWIDVNDLSHVVNFELPENPESYTHRIWRTWRAWKSGTAISIVSSADFRKLWYIERTIKAKINKANLPNGQDVVNFKKTGLLNDLNTLIEAEDTVDYADIAAELLNNKEAQNVVSALLKKFYKDEFKAESYTDFTASSSRRETSTRRDSSSSQGSFNNDWMVRLFVAKGKKDGFENPGQLLWFIAREAGLWDLGAGRVDVLTNFSYVDLPQDIAFTVLDDAKAKNNEKPLIVKAKPKTDDGDSRGGSRWWDRGWYRGGSRWWDRGWYRGNSDRGDSRGGDRGWYRTSSDRGDSRGGDRGWYRGNSDRGGDRGWYRGNSDRGGDRRR